MSEPEQPGKYIFEALEDFKNVVHEKDDSQIDISWFDLSFAEFPLGFLTQRLPKGVDRHKIVYRDMYRGKNGEIKPREWIIQSGKRDKQGNPIPLPGLTATKLMIQLIQHGAEQNFFRNRISFGKFHELCGLVGITPGGKSYEQLERDLLSISGINIIANHAYWDAEEGAYGDINLSPFSDLVFYRKGKPGQPRTGNDSGFFQINKM